MFSYYDIDAILAEEELVPVTNLFNFPYLAHLDPDYVVREHQGSQLYFQPNNDSIHAKQGVQKQRSSSSSPDAVKSHLKANTKFYMPLWSLTNWTKAKDRCINIQLPKHYRRKTRDRLNSDAVSVDLRYGGNTCIAVLVLQKKFSSPRIRNMNERYFMSGILIITLITKYKARYAKTSRRSAQDVALNDLFKDMKELEKCLLLAYTGARLRRIFDWTMSHIDDDVSAFTENLTMMELTLFRLCAAATRAYSSWVIHGSRRILKSETALKLLSCQPSKEKRNQYLRRDLENMNQNDRGLSINKRIRV